MTIRMINGFPVYAVTRAEVEYHPSYFQQQAKTWVEGFKRDQLSEEEIENLKKKYHSANLSKEDTVALFGELVEAGLMSTATARNIYCGAVPMDTSRINPTNTQGVLTKCDPVSGAFGGLGTMFGIGGLGSYRNLYEYAKKTTDVDVENSQYFQEYRQFLNILDQIGA